MRKRYLFASGLVLLAILLALVEWQVSFDFGEYGPADTAQTFVFWAVSTLIFLLTVTLGFMLFRTGVKLYFERQSGSEGSRIKTKLVLGALALSLLPVAFLVSFSYTILNRTLDKWFGRPAEGVKFSLIDTAVALDDEVQHRAQALANWIALMPDLESETSDFSKLCIENRIAELRIDSDAGTRIVCNAKEDQSHPPLTAFATLADGAKVAVRVYPLLDIQAKKAEIEGYVQEYNQVAANRKNIRTQYLLFILLITLFILFVSTWMALILARQISVPISALLGAAQEVRKGNLSYRVAVKAMDELATLVRGFNEMMHELESATSCELESCRHATEAISGVLPLPA